MRRRAFIAAVGGDLFRLSVCDSEGTAAGPSRRIAILATQEAWCLPGEE
jgi:hypothetical protein